MDLDKDTDTDTNYYDTLTQQYPEYYERTARAQEKMHSLPIVWKDGPPWTHFPGFAFCTSIAVKKNNPLAVLPKQAHTGDAGFDLCSVEDLVIPPGKFTAVDTGLSFAMDGNLECQVRPRSGMAAKHGVTVLNAPGTIDSTYTGPVKVLLVNHGEKPFEIKAGDRIAQAVFAFLPTVVMEETQELPNSERGQGGFGSTGVK